MLNALFYQKNPFLTQISKRSIHTDLHHPPLHLAQFFSLESLKISSAYSKTSLGLKMEKFFQTIGVFVGAVFQGRTCRFISDFANSEHKHKHKHKRKNLLKISAAWPSFTLNTTWLQPCLQHFTVQTTCLSFNILASWCLLNGNYAVPYKYIIKQCLVNDNTHFFSYYVAGLFRKPVLNKERLQTRFTIFLALHWLVCESFTL